MNLKKLKIILKTNWKNYLLFLTPFVVSIPIISFFVIKNSDENLEKISVTEKEINFPEIEISRYDQYLSIDEKNKEKILNEDFLALIIKDVLINFSSYNVNLTYATKIESSNLAYIFFTWNQNNKIYTKNFKIELQ